MRFRPGIWTSVLIGILCTWGDIAHGAYSLEDCYSKALSRSETVAIQGELIDQAEERYRQASGGLFPNITGVGSYTRIDAPPGQSTAFTRPDRPEIRIAATQPIFRGFREYAAIRLRRHDVAAQESQRRAAAIQLYQDVAENFYTLLSLEQELKNVNAQLELRRKRVRELQTRRRIGRSRTSEVLAVQSSVAQLESQQAALATQIAAAREVFVFLTGLERDAELSEVFAKAAELSELKFYLERVDARPDVEALSKQVAVADEEVAVARGGHLPSIDLSGNYYLKRVGVLENQKWDVQALLTLPIFAGGVIQSQVREAKSRERAAQLALVRAKEEAVREIRTFYAGVKLDRSQVAALVRAAELAERSYAEQSREYRLGLVTNLEVLQSLDVLYATRQALDRARFAEKLDLARLESAAALRPKELN